MKTFLWLIGAHLHGLRFGCPRSVRLVAGACHERRTMEELHAMEMMMARDGRSGALSRSDAQWRSGARWKRINVLLLKLV